MKSLCHWFVVAMLVLAACRSRDRHGAASRALGGDMYGGGTYAQPDAAEYGDGDEWRPATPLPDSLPFAPAGDHGLWFDEAGGVLYGARSSFDALNAQLASMLAMSPTASVAPIRRIVYDQFGVANLADMLANAEGQAGGANQCVATCYLFAERLKAFPYSAPSRAIPGAGDLISTAAEAFIRRTGTYPSSPGINGRREDTYGVTQSAAFGVQLELVCEYTKPCAGQTLQCGVDIDQTISGGMQSHAKVETNLNPWGFGNRPGAKAEQVVKAGFFRKGQAQPVELNLTQQAEARITCGYQETFSELVSDCLVVDLEGLNWKCKRNETVLKIAKSVYQCAKNTDHEKKEGTTLSGGYKEDRFIAELAFNPNHTPKLTTVIGQTHLSYGRDVSVRDTSDASLTHFARATGSASIAIKAGNFAVKGGSAPGAACQGVSQNGGFLSITLEAKPTELPTPLPTELASCNFIGTKLTYDPKGITGCMKRNDCLRSADGHVFVLQSDGRGVLYDATKSPPQAKYWTPGSSWPAMKFTHICVAEQVAFINGGPATRTAYLGIGLKEGNAADVTLDERPFTGTGVDLTCGPQPSLTIHNGQMVLMHHNGGVCKTYSVIQ